MGRKEEQTHAFIQVLDGRRHHVSYHRFPIDQFQFSRDRFQVRIGENHFNSDSLEVATDDTKARLNFHEKIPWPVTLRSPGIMGWYAWIPFMECYHGVVSLGHRVSGALNIGGEHFQLDGGRGYIEKDWGKNFPKTWVWTQGNNFSFPGTSLTASIARIPWIGRTFTGFIIGIQCDRHLYRFATYTGAVLKNLKIGENDFHCLTENKAYQLEIKASRTDFARLRGPTPDGMTAIVKESLNAELWVKLSTKEAKTVFEGESVRAGLEIEGDTALLC
jgi:hypothetical protein